MLFTNCMPPYSCHKLIIVSLLNDVNVYNKIKNTYTFLTKLNYARSKHTHNTSFAINKCLSLPKPRTEYLKNSLSYSGVL